MKQVPNRSSIYSQPPQPSTYSQAAVECFLDETPGGKTLALFVFLATWGTILCLLFGV